MITTIVFDFSRTLLFYNDESYSGSLNKMHKKLSEDENYQFFDHYSFNKQLVDFISQYKDKYQLYIFTSGNLHEMPGIKEIVDEVFIRVIKSHEFDLEKTDPHAYQVLSSTILEVPAEEILFIDDQIERINAAKESGVNTIHFQTNEQTISELKTVLNLEE